MLVPAHGKLLHLFLKLVKFDLLFSTFGSSLQIQDNLMPLIGDAF